MRNNLICILMQKHKKRKRKSANFYAFPQFFFKYCHFHNRHSTQIKHILFNLKIILAVRNLLRELLSHLPPPQMHWDPSDVPALLKIQSVFWRPHSKAYLFWP